MSALELPSFSQRYHGLDLWIGDVSLTPLPWQRFPGIRSSEQTSGSEVLTLSELGPTSPNYPLRTKVLVEQDLQVAEFLICCPAGVLVPELLGKHPLPSLQTA